MLYMVLMFADPAESKAMSAAHLDVVKRKHAGLRAELTESGELRNGAGLAFPDETSNLRWNEGVTVGGEGPLVEAKEHLTAYYVVDCVDSDRALAIAERMLDSHVTSVELRYIHDSTGM